MSESMTDSPEPTTTVDTGAPTPVGPDAVAVAQQGPGLTDRASAWADQKARELGNKAKEKTGAKYGEVKRGTQRKLARWLLGVVVRLDPDIGLRVLAGEEPVPSELTDDPEAPPAEDPNTANQSVVAQASSAVDSTPAPTPPVIGGLDNADDEDGSSMFRRPAVNNIAPTPTAPTIEPVLPTAPDPVVDTPATNPTPPTREAQEPAVEPGQEAEPVVTSLQETIDQLEAQTRNLHAEVGRFASLLATQQEQHTQEIATLREQMEKIDNDSKMGTRTAVADLLNLTNATDTEMKKSLIRLIMERFGLVILASGAVGLAASVKGAEKGLEPTSPQR